jgi:hypothetical protein
MFNLPDLKLIRTLVAAVSITSAASAVTAQVTATSGDPATIAAIDASVTAIDRDTGRYTSTTHTLDGYSTEGGELRGLFDGVVLHRLAIRLYGEMGRVDQLHYYSGEQLVFIRLVRELYDQPLSGRVRVRVEHTLYFTGGKLIRQVRTQTPALPGQDFAPGDPEISQLLVVAKEMVVCARSANTTCVAPPR